MENIILIISILGIHVLAWFTFGPSMVLIIRNSLVYSRKTGIYTAVGIMISNFIHVTYSVVAIIFLTSISPISIIIKFLGAGYLTYLGIKTILKKPHAKNNEIKKEDETDISKWRGIRTGFITNILSAKASLFFIAIFGTVISSGSPLWVIIFLMIAMPILSLVMASMWAIIFSYNKAKSIYNKHQGIVNKFLGATLILLALLIVFL
jgi:threonine/homoserine/homoserine lactone efflux protein